jgi:hypothetical protein
MLPFRNGDVYGRSFMECSSFIASSAFEDLNQRDRGFLARSSGSTAEFLSMWSLMMIGPNPSYMDKKSGNLVMKHLPALPRWRFAERPGMDPTVRFKLHVRFTLHGSIDVTTTIKEALKIFTVYLPPAISLVSVMVPFSMSKKDPSFRPNSPLRSAV